MHLQEKLTDIYTEKSAVRQEPLEVTDKASRLCNLVISDMTSCAFPSSVSASTLWSFPVEDQVISSPTFGWPTDICNKKIKEHCDDDTNKVLDFARLESDILKNVLGEEDEQKAKDDVTYQNSNDIFPSFNFLPAPIPHSLIKANPILKLYPRDHVMSTMRFYDKQSQSLINNHAMTLASNPYAPLVNHQSVHFPEQQQKLPEAYSSSTEKHPHTAVSAHMTESFGKSRQEHPLPLQCPCAVNLLTVSSSVASPYLYTIPVTSQAYMTSSLQRSAYKNPSSVGYYVENYFAPRKLTTNHLYNSVGVAKLEQSQRSDSNAAAPSMTSPAVMTPQSSEQQQVTENRTFVATRRNLTPGVPPKDDQKKRKLSQEETVMTFAQIVAASRPTEGRTNRYHE